MARIDPQGGSRRRTERRRDAHRDLLRLVWGESPDPDEGMHAAADLVRKVLEAAGAADGIDEQRLKEAWRSLAGEAVAAHCQPVAFRKGLVELRVLQPAMKFHLEQMKPHLLLRLRELLGDDRVRGVRFVIG